MKKFSLANNKGFTLIEMVVAAGIMTVVVFGGFQAYQYFNSQTIKEAKKMDDISEFNALTKDLLQFTEGAGISTFYLNLPIKTQGCNDTEPCVRELVGEKFSAPTAALPSVLSANTCMQFYKDAKGKIESKLAYPSKHFLDKLWESKPIELSLTQELYATWPLKDTTSAPFMMVKGRDSSLYLKQLSGRVQTGMGDHGGLAHSFYESDAAKENILKLHGYPFLTYSAMITNQYIIQYAHEIVSCQDERAKCITLMKKITDSSESGFWDDSRISIDIDAAFPNKVYAIEFRPIEFNQPFFKEIFDRQQLASACLSSWGDGKQSESGTFFPSVALSVTSPASDPVASADLSVVPQNQLYLNKYSLDRLNKSQKGMWVTLPIDIITFRVEQDAPATPLKLVSQMWHNTEIKKKTKIHNLKAPFTITRKLGSPEMGIWYNPIKKNSP